MAPLASIKAEPSVPKLRYIDAISAIAVTLCVFVSMVERWQAYRLFDKCTSVAVLFILLTLPWGAVRMERRGQRLEVWQTYMLVLLALSVFR